MIKRSERQVKEQLKRLHEIWKQNSAARMRVVTQPGEVEFYMACGAIQVLDWLLGLEEPLHGYRVENPIRKKGGDTDVSHAHSQGS